ncbi:MAG: sugar phosphate isomerase/epimerase family protein [Acidimicrobiales bacterium]|jgi:sugar phosphate isomerase/epimerase
MKIGIDSYCFHRYFGEIYPGLQTDPGTRWRMEGEFLDFALRQDVDEIALEACFFDALDDGLCAEVKARLDDAGVDRVLGWGHPEGLWGGTRPEELESLKRHIPQTLKLGSNRMRITAASMNYAKAPREELIGRVIPMLAEAARAAQDQGVVLALENHIDFTSQELLRIIEVVGSENLRVNFDTGNAIRLFEDPVEAAARLAPYTISTHTKDIATRRKGGSPSENFTWWPACPAGEGVIDLPGVVKALQEGGFDGSLSLEVDLIGEQWASLPEEEIVIRSLDYLRTLLPSGPSA